MKKTKRLIVFAAVCISIAAAFISCGPKFNGTVVNDLCAVVIPNPELYQEIGFSDAPLPRAKSPGFNIHVSVITTDANNVAKEVGYKDAKYVHATIDAKSMTSFTISDIKIPLDVPFVIKYTLTSLDCTWPGTQNCSAVGIHGSASKKDYTDSHPFVIGNPGTYYFSATGNHKFRDNCCQ